MKTTKHFRLSAILVLAMLLLLPCASRAGTGEIRDGKLDLSVLFLYREAEPDTWKPVFDEASQLLYNATNGQLQLGRIRVYACGTDNPDIDIWVQDNFTGAFANLFGLGGTGHVFLSQVHESSSDPALGQFGLVHELGHYAFGLYDEYKGVTEDALGAPLAEQTNLRMPNQYCVTDDHEIGCVMDGGTIVSPNNHRTEFCTHADGGLSTQHNAGVVVGDTRYINAQEFYNHESCWETIARIAGLETPDIVDPIDPAGLEPIDWQVVNGLDNLVLCLDRSASMYAAPTPITLVREAALSIVDLLRAEKTIQEDGSELTIPGENLAVVSFAHEPVVDFPLQPMEDEDTRVQARAAIEDGDQPYLDLEESDLGSALGTALREIEIQSEVPSCSESIVLLTDGNHTSGGSPLDIVPDLVERGVRVYSIGVGPDVNEDLLRTLSSETRGQFFRLESSEDLPDIFTAVAAAIRADGTTATFGDSVSGSGEHLPILMDSFAEEFTAILSWDEGLLDLVLVTPSGERIDIGSAESREDVEAIRGEGFLYIRVVHPELGTWIAEITPEDPDVTSQFEMTVLESDRGVNVTATTDRQVYDFPDPVKLRVDVLAGVPVAGAVVKANVIRPGWPNVTSVPIDIFDDGDPAHGDEWADDGVYNAIFDSYARSGIYTFQIRVENIDGTGPDPDLPFVEDGGAPPTSIPPFVREFEVSIELQGAGDPVIGEAEIHPATLNVGNSNGSVTVYLELPEPYSVQDIDPSSILLGGHVVPRSTPRLGDHDENGRPDLTLKFDRGEVIETLPLDMNAEVVLTGMLHSDWPFYATGTVTAFDPHDDSSVTFGSEARVGSTTRISWTPSSAQPATYNGFLSLDDGDTWQPIFTDVEGTDFEWTVAEGPSANARVLVEARSPERLVAQIESASFPILDSTTDAPAGLATAFLGFSPSPVRDNTTIRFSLAAIADVELTIFDVSGRALRRFSENGRVAGEHSISWDGTDEAGHQLSSGVYLYRFRAGDVRAEGRVLIAR